MYHICTDKSRQAHLSKRSTKRFFLYFENHGEPHIEDPSTQRGHVVRLDTASASITGRKSPASRLTPVYIGNTFIVDYHNYIPCTRRAHPFILLYCVPAKRQKVRALYLPTVLYLPSLRTNPSRSDWSSPIQHKQCCAGVGTGWTCL